MLLYRTDVTEVAGQNKWSCLKAGPAQNNPAQ